jgi:hypothetical protein
MPLCKSKGFLTLTLILSLLLNTLILSFLINSTRSNLITYKPFSFELVLSIRLASTLSPYNNGFT